MNVLKPQREGFDEEIEEHQESLYGRSIRR
jgi:hypothetical protein